MMSETAVVVWRILQSNAFRYVLTSFFSRRCLHRVYVYVVIRFKYFLNWQRTKFCSTNKHFVPKLS